MKRFYTPISDEGGSVDVTRTSGPSREACQVPPIDLYETENGWVLVADVPGVGKDDVAIEVDRGVLTLHARVRAATPGGRVVHAEFESADFFRSFPLSDLVDRNRIAASVSGGVLTITLPKADEARPRRIVVEGGS